MSVRMSTKEEGRKSDPDKWDGRLCMAVREGQCNVTTQADASAFHLETRHVKSFHSLT